MPFQGPKHDTLKRTQDKKAQQSSYERNHLWTQKTKMSTSWKKKSSSPQKVQIIQTPTRSRFQDPKADNVHMSEKT